MASTIYDVAALAGVSPATVSRVLNGSAVSPEKTERVRAAVAQLDFPTARPRAAGCLRVVAERSPGLDADRYLRHTDYRPGGARVAAASLRVLPDPPDAIFAANNLLGVGALAQLVESGHRPPAVG